MERPKLDLSKHPSVVRYKKALDNAIEGQKRRHRQSEAFRAATGKEIPTKRANLGYKVEEVDVKAAMSMLRKAKKGTAKKKTGSAPYPKRGPKP